jgi:hypothetical protein
LPRAWRGVGGSSVTASWLLLGVVRRVFKHGTNVRTKKWQEAPHPGSGSRPLWCQWEGEMTEKREDACFVAASGKHKRRGGPWEGGDRGDRYLT